MKKTLLLLSTMLLTVAACAQTTRKFVVYPNGAKMTAYLPANPSGRAIVDLPGGGYAFLATDHEGHQWAPWMNERGTAFFVLEYRMPKGDRTIPLNDAYAAMKMVRDSAAAWHINPYDVGIMGFSAGGHLASAVSTHAEWTVRPNFSVLFYPVITMNEATSHAGSCINFLGEGRKDPKLVKQWSSEEQVQEHLTPPAVLLLSNDDDVVPPVTNGVAYYSALRRQNLNASMFIYRSGGHGWGFGPTAFHEQMLRDLDGWLATLKAPRQDAIRVACIGNSITCGMGIPMNDNLGYPAVLQQLLGDGYQVKNFGVSARTLLYKGDLPYVKEEAWHDAQAFCPDVVILKLGTNDAKDYNWVHGADFGHDLQLMLDTLKALPTHPKIFLCSPIPAAKIWGISDSVIVNGEMPVIRKVAKKNKATYIDLHTLFNNSDGKQMQRDGIHPNKNGAAQLARIIAPYIKGEKK